MGYRMLVGWVLLCGLTVGHGAWAAEWQELEIETTGTYVRWYRPDSVPAEAAVPLVIFLHGAGSTPEAWMPLLQDHAEDGAFVLALPKSISGYGWGVGRDHETLRQLLAELPQETPFDRRRVGLAGHSSGGAFAYVAALGGPLRIASVFSLAAPFRTVLEVADPTHTPALRLYYGTQDPNFNILAPLGDMLDRLGVAWEVEVAPGFGHNSWPDTTLDDGFAFLQQHALTGPCEPSPQRLCLLGGRFAVELSWRDGQDRVGVGTRVEQQTTDSGLLWFFREANWELLVKVLDGCGVNGHYWVFAAAATDVEYELRVTDLATGQEVSYFNTLGQASSAINDIGAFASCP